MFENLNRLEADPILGLMAAFRADPRSRKVDLGVGVYQDESGQTPIMAAVKDAESRLLASEQTKTYQGIAGDPAFNERLLELVFGPDHAVLRAARARSIQTPGGCGALRIGAEVIRRARPGARVWVSAPTWANHVPLIGGAGLELCEYPYYDAARRGVDFDAMMSSLADVAPGDVVLLHGCCHNPSGADLDHAEWNALAELAQRNGFTPFIDIAYQGLADGVEEDAYGVRLMARELPEVIVASSCSKNFGLYRERTGAVAFIGGSEAMAEAVASHAMAAARQIYSMPPAHGAAIVAEILVDAELRRRWLEELAEVRSRIASMRELLAARLAENDAGIDFGFIPRQKGMFSFLGISAAQVETLRREYGVYMIGSTRINLAGINPGNIDYVADSVRAVLRPSA